MKKIKQDNSKNLKPEADKTETIRDLAHRHLTDENHTTTDEEIRGAAVELSNVDDIDGDNVYEITDETLILPLPRKKNSTEEDLPGK